MSLLRKMGVAALIVACCPWSVSQAGVYVGIGVPGPYYYRPYRPWYGYGYGGVYVAPPPVVVGGAAPVVVQQPAVVQPGYAPSGYAQPGYAPSGYAQPSSAPPAPAPTPLPMPTPNSSVSNAPGSPDLMPAAAVGGGQADIDAALQQLRAGDEQARANAAVQLGRLRAEQAIGPIVRALNGDSSPIVREAAARSLGLIGSPNALSALQYAAQADNDREVRHSASFAAETIRGNLRR